VRIKTFEQLKLWCWQTIYGFKSPTPCSFPNIKRIEMLSLGLQQSQTTDSISIGKEDYEE
jgi:hypothetical protein